MEPSKDVKDMSKLEVFELEPETMVFTRASELQRIYLMGWDDGLNDRTETPVVIRGEIW